MSINNYGINEEKSPMRKVNRVNTFDNQMKIGMAKQNRGSPHCRISFSIDEEGFKKYDNFK
jgi:hypothetical protein